MRGSRREVGSICYNGKGYALIKIEKEGKTSWKLYHQVIFEQKMGRPKRPNERLYFIDGDITNLSPDNISSRTLGENNIRRRKRVIEEKIKILQEELNSINKEIEMAVIDRTTIKKK